jgi:branched-chain amino acid transport system ATP-binding protein
VSDSVLEITDLTVTFGGVVALDRVNFSLQGTELLGLIGPNGAGKTTVMRAITGVVRQDSGAARLGGRDLRSLPVHARIRAGLGISQQLTRPFRAMTTLDNVALAAGAERTRRPMRAMFASDRSAEREEALRLLQLVGIGDASDRTPDTLPLGYLKRLEVARALALKPRLLHLGEVARICSRLVVLDNGRVLADGPTETVLADTAVQDAYLGRGNHAAA